MVADHWAMRKQIYSLAVFDLVKRTRGTALSWLWLIIKPAMYVLCFWFALEVGLRQTSGNPDVPFILWLCAGYVPWYFISGMIQGGSNVLRRYQYLVTKVRFPLSCISAIYALSSMLVDLMLFAILFLIYFLCGGPLDVHLLQVPFLIALMFVFWEMVSIMFSQISAMSKDFSNLIGALSTPFFWISGVIFDMSRVNVPAVQVAFNFNPITFFVTAFRDVFVDRCWVWEDQGAFLTFFVIFAMTLVVMLAVYKRLSREVPDVI